MIEFKERGRGTKWHHKTPRSRINRLGGDRVAYKEANWFKNNWEDDRAKWAFNGIERFLKVNIGRPVNKVYSEFLERCDKSTKSYNLKKIFYDHIEEKENITWYGGFYVTNGILNYKKRTSRPKSCESLSGYINTEEYNRNNMPVLKPICELADETHKKQLVGTLYYNYSREPRPVYLIRKEDWLDIGNKDSLKYKLCTISGIGDSVVRSVYSRMSKPNILMMYSLTRLHYTMRGRSFKERASKKLLFMLPCLTESLHLMMYLQAERITKSYLMVLVVWAYILHSRDTMKAMAMVHGVWISLNILRR